MWLRAHRLAVEVAVARKEIRRVTVDTEDYSTHQVSKLMPSYMKYLLTFIQWQNVSVLLVGFRFTFFQNFISKISLQSFEKKSLKNVFFSKVSSIDIFFRNLFFVNICSTFQPFNFFYIKPFPPKNLGFELCCPARHKKIPSCNALLLQCYSETTCCSLPATEPKTET